MDLSDPLASKEIVDNHLLTMKGSMIMMNIDVPLNMIIHNAGIS